MTYAEYSKKLKDDKDHVRAELHNGHSIKVIVAGQILDIINLHDPDREVPVWDIQYNCGQKLPVVLHIKKL